VVTLNCPAGGDSAIDMHCLGTGTGPNKTPQGKRKSNGQHSTYGVPGRPLDPGPIAKTRLRVGDMLSGAATIRRKLRGRQILSAHARSTTQLSPSCKVSHAKAQVGASDISHQAHLDR
jgi:hypothetical protein